MDDHLHRHARIPAPGPKLVLEGSESRDHDGNVEQLADLDDDVEALIGDEARHPEHEGGRERVEGQALGIGQRRPPLTRLDSRHIDRGVDHCGLTPPGSFDAVGDESAVGGDGCRVLRRASVDVPQGRPGDACRETASAGIQLRSPEIPRRCVDVDILGNARRVEPHVMGEHVGGDERPLVMLLT